MDIATNVKKEPKYHLSRKQNTSGGFKFSVRFLAVLISFIFVIVVFSLIGKFSPGATISYMFEGNYGTTQNTDQTLLNIFMLFVLALALAPAFKMKYWNTGALGQALIGNACAGVVIYKLGPYVGSNFLLLLIAFIAAIIGGAFWGVIPGIFKAKLKSNETLFTLMMNYVAIQIVKIVIELLKGGAQSLSPSTYGKFNYIGSFEYGWPLIITILVALFIYIYLKFTKHGYEIAVLGESPNTAKYAGINTTAVIIRTAAISGALCAVCGFMYAGATQTVSIESDGGFGFTSIIVTWSSHFSVLAMFVISFLIVFLKMGSDGVKNKASQYMNGYASYIAVGIFLFFLIGCEFFLNFKFVPNSELARKQEEKRKVLREKHPRFYAWYDATKVSLVNFFDKINAIFSKCKNAVLNFFVKCFTAIKNFFLKIFKKKGVQE